MKLKAKEKEMSGGGDGIRADIDGNIWVGAWGGEGFDGVHIFAPDGQRIGQILLPEATSNICFGGPKRNRLFITASQSLYAVYVEARARILPKNTMSKTRTIFLLLLLSASFSIIAAQTTDNYEPGPDSKPQPGVPKGEILKFSFR